MSKNGFSYYKAETDRYQDIKIKRLKKQYKCDGYAIYQYALNEIYRVEGCYIRWTEDQMFDCADYWDMDEARVKEIIDYCAEIGLFDTMAWQRQCILTARSIQSRYLDICKVSKKKAYIPLEIMLVEAQVEMKQPEPMPLFEENAPQQAVSEAKNAPTNAPIMPVAEQEFRNVSGTFAKTPESSGNIHENFDKEKKSKENKSERKENASSTPPAFSGTELSDEDARILVSSAIDRVGIQAGAPAARPIADDGKNRNPQGLLQELQKYSLTAAETEEVLRLSHHGEIDNPVWAILNEIRTSKRIKIPRLFLLSRLRGAMGDIATGKKVAAS